jgi:hypothetical protein
MRNEMARRALITLQVAFVLVFCFLVYSNVTLRRRLDLAEGGSHTRPRPFAVSEAIPPVKVQDRDGRAMTFDARKAGNRLLVLVHPNCHYCEAVLKEIAAHPAADVDVVSLASRAMSSKVTLHVPAPASLYFVERAETSALRPRAVVPQLLRIDRSGRVARVCSSYQDCAEATKLTQCRDCG